MAEFPNKIEVTHLTQQFYHVIVNQSVGDLDFKAWCMDQGYTVTDIDIHNFLVEDINRASLWDVVSSSGAIISSTPYFGNSKAATSFMHMMHSHSELQIAEVVDLDKITFESRDESDEFKCMFGDRHLCSLKFGPGKDEVTLIGEDEFNDEVVKIELLTDLPAFAAIAPESTKQ